MEKLPVSVFIIARNEADRIPLTIHSVRDWVDEVIVIDSGSEDDTVQVAESLGAQVVFNEWRGYGPQKVFGESLWEEYRRHGVRVGVAMVSGIEGSASYERKLSAPKRRI